MATRGTREEAEKLAERLRADYPSADIRVEDKSRWYEGKITLRIAQERGYQIIGEPDADGWVLTRSWNSTFEVYEVRTCRSGHIRHTIAFGESSPCPECNKSFNAKFQSSPQPDFGPDFEWDTRDQGGEFAGWKDDSPRDRFNPGEID